MKTDYRIFKFGGSSVETSERLLRAVEIIHSARQSGPVAVVVSAMGDTTDLLLQAAALAARGELDSAQRVAQGIAERTCSHALQALCEIQRGRPASDSQASLAAQVRSVLLPLNSLLQGIGLLREKTPQTLDLVMSFGEMLSAHVLAGLLAARGLESLVVDARAWTVTDDHFGAAGVDEEASRARVLALVQEWGSRIPVITGFLGQTPDGRTTTLGRNGSDYTATLLAAAIGAEEVVRWTDVSGVMTADPAIVAEAYPLAHLSYMEALELADFGASLFHPRTMIPLIDSGIPLRIRNTLQPDHPGTVIDARGCTDESRATSVTSLESLALLGVQSRRLTPQARLSGRVLKVIDAAGISVRMATEASLGQAVALVIPEAQAEAARAAIHQELAQELERGEVEPVSVERPVTLLTLVGEAMGQTPQVAGRFFHALGAIGINIRAIGQGASARSVSCAIAAAETKNAVRAVHAAFNFAHQEVNLLILGKGTVGGALLQQIRAQRSRLEQHHDIRLKVVGIARKSSALFDPNGIDLEQWPTLLDKAGQPEGGLVSLLDRQRRLAVPILIDCTAADGMESLYREAFQRGINVVSANKKPLAITWPERERLVQLARQQHRSWRYETTVGASLPIIETLQDLVRTGDRVELIEGSFSGTLGYIMGELAAGVPLSRATRKARDLGYSEPNPQDDLAGADVARKALILARELGLSMELEDIHVEPLVPRELLTPMPADKFLSVLEELDAPMAAQFERLAREEKTLRYLVRIDPSPQGGRPSARVGPLAVELDHPATRLKGTEALVAFSTERYCEHPLVVQGAGAGGSVTAAGVLADALKIAQTLRGR
jgi:aspartokinase/homoserine dehydrogenase 1